MSSSPGPAPEGLAGVRVTVCRARESALELVAELRRRGADVDLMPLQQSVPPADGGAALADAVRRVHEFHWLAVTSANAVDPLLDAGLSPPVPGGLRVAAVGPATARALTAAGFAVDVVPAMATAADLARALAGTLATQAPGAGGIRVLAPLAERASTDLEIGLRVAGCSVLRVDAYRMADVTPSVNEIEQAVTADAVVLGAPSTAERLAAIVGPRRPSAVVAIGPRTATRARELGFPLVIEALATDAIALGDATELAVGGGLRSR